MELTQASRRKATEKQRRSPPKDLARKLEELEKKYDAQFKVVFDVIRQLMASPEKGRRSIGYRVEEAGPIYRLRRHRRASAR